MSKSGTATYAYSPASWRRRHTPPRTLSAFELDRLPSVHRANMPLLSEILLVLILADHASFALLYRFVQKRQARTLAKDCRALIENYSISENLAERLTNIGRG